MGECGLSKTFVPQQARPAETVTVTFNIDTSRGVIATEEIEDIARAVVGL